MISSDAKAHGPIVVVAELPDIEAFRRWSGSPEYQAIASPHELSSFQIKIAGEQMGRGLTYAASVPLGLRRVQPRIRSALRKKGGVCALFHNTAFFQHHNLVCIAHR